MMAEQEDTEQIDVMDPLGLDDEEHVGKHRAA